MKKYEDVMVISYDGGVTYKRYCNKDFKNGETLEVYTALANLDENDNIIEITHKMEHIQNLKRADNFLYLKGHPLTNNISTEACRRGYGYGRVNYARHDRKFLQQLKQEYINHEQQRVLADRNSKYAQIQTLLPNATEQQIDDILDILENN